MSINNNLTKIKSKTNQEINLFFKRNALKVGLQDRELLEIIDRLRKFCLGGKKIRVALAYYTYLACGGKKTMQFFKAVISLELFHNFFLIHDDIIDNDQTRRGELAFHKFCEKKFNDSHLGISIAIFAANLLNFYGYENIINSDISSGSKEKILQLLNNNFKKVGQGEILDILFTKRKLIYEQEIIFQYQYKTGSYTVNLPILFGAYLAGASRRQINELIKFAKPLGLAFQIQDDILDIFGDQNKIGKDLGSDIINNKKTILINYVMKNITTADKHFLNSLIGRKKLKKQELTEVKTIIKKGGALDYCNFLTTQLVSKSQNNFKRSIFKDEISKLLALTEFMIKRNS